jgi:hypothetical protein
MVDKGVIEEWVRKRLVEDKRSVIFMGWPRRAESSRGFPSQVTILPWPWNGEVFPDDLVRIDRRMTGFRGLSCLRVKNNNSCATHAAKVFFC